MWKTMQAITFDDVKDDFQGFIKYLENLSCSANQEKITLNFSYSPVTDDQLCMLDCFCVSELGLADAKISEKGLSGIKNKKSIKKLDLAWCDKIKQWDWLADFKNLEDLILTDTSITSKDLERFANKKFLKNVYFDTYYGTVEEYERLSKLFPKTIIDFDRAPKFPESWSEWFWEGPPFVILIIIVALILFWLKWI